MGETAALQIRIAGVYEYGTCASSAMQENCADSTLCWRCRQVSQADLEQADGVPGADTIVCAHLTLGVWPRANVQAHCDLPPPSLCRRWPRRPRRGVLASAPRCTSTAHKHMPRKHLPTAGGIPAGKYTQGLGQGELGFCGDREDVISMAATAMLRLMEAYDVSPADIGM